VLEVLITVLSSIECKQPYYANFLLESQGGHTVSCVVMQWFTMGPEPVPEDREIRRLNAGAMFAPKTPETNSSQICVVVKGME
jgi:hypothetical protein